MKFLLTKIKETLLEKAKNRYEFVVDAEDKYSIMINEEK